MPSPDPSSRSPAAVHALTVAVALAGVLALVTTRDRLSNTIDEGNHVAAGLEWWQYGTYTLWTENPPLARVALAALPYFAGVRLGPRADWDPHHQSVEVAWFAGIDALHGGPGGGYEANLRRARLGIFPFFLVTLACTFLLACGRRRPVAGLVAVGLVASYPALLAHAGLATTDAAFVATFLVAVLTAQRWYERPTPGRAAGAGIGFALALLTKFSALAFVPLTLLALLVARRLTGQPVGPRLGDVVVGRRRLAAHAGLAFAVATLAVWAGYRFSVGSIGALPAECINWFLILPPPAERGALTRALLALPLPAPELFHGFLFFRGHNVAGHTAYVFGELSRSGFASLYPLAFLLKSPLPYLAALLAAVAVAVRRTRATHPSPDGWRALGAALGAVLVVLLSSQSRVTLGLRHVLVLVPLLAIAAGLTLAASYEDAGLAVRRRLASIGLASLLAGQALVTWRARPNLLGYFSPLAGADPAAILLDSDRDWGQDLFQLRAEARARGIANLKIAYFGIARLCEQGLPPLAPLVPGKPTGGWIAISENFYRERNLVGLLPDPCNLRRRYRREEIPPHGYAWLRAHQPVALVGTSIRLYHLPDPVPGN